MRKNRPGHTKVNQPSDRKQQTKQQTMRILLLAATLLSSVTLNAKLTVTRLTCNYQQGLAVTTGDIRMGWQMTSDTDGDRQTAYRIRITENVTGKKVYDSGKTQSEESRFVTLPQLKSNRHGYLWQVQVWDGKGRPSAWSGTQQVRVVPESLGAKWIGAITKKAARLPEGRWSNGVFKKDTFKTKWADVDSLSARSIIVRKEFTNGRKKVTDAVVYVCGLGHYELRINGAKVGDSEFAPLWSEYDKTAYYNTYDVTPLLRKGGNAVSVLLGNGFFNVQRQGRYSKLQTSFGPPQVILRMEINYNDGSSKTITSGTDWKYALSPITFNSIYGGESYDARLLQKGFDTAGFDDRAWKTVVETEGPKGRLTAQTAPPVKIMEKYGVKNWNDIPADSLSAASKATKRTVSPSAAVADMGQNLAGFPEISVKGRKGQKVTLLVAEKLTRQGVCDQRQTGRQHYYEYTIGSDTVETWHPRFT